LKDREIGFIVSKALALVFPSIYEGFGLPPLEAAMLGTPSICSSRPAMTELMDGVALFASPDKPEEWAQSIKMLRDNALFRNKLGLLAKKRAETFSWKTCSESLVEELSLLSEGNDSAGV
jgi:glycosyltransferase involved in cell wall biosynthesis